MIRDLKTRPLFGIDVSLYQRDIDWQLAAAEGVEFAIIKASENNFRDHLFEQHYQKAKEAGIMVGARHYLTAKTPKEAEEQAEYFLNVIKGKKFDFPLWVEAEGDDLAQLTKEAATDVVLAFVRYCRQKNQYIGVYSYDYYLTYNLLYDILKVNSIDIWLGSISTHKPDVLCAIWQFGGDRNLLRSNMIGGVVCDQNYCYIDYPKILKKIEESNKVDFNAYPGNDNKPKEWSRDAVEWAIRNGLIQGDENGLQLRQTLTLERFLTILNRYDNHIRKE